MSIFTLICAFYLQNWQLLSLCHLPGLVLKDQIFSSGPRQHPPDAEQTHGGRDEEARVQRPRAGWPP